MQEMQRKTQGAWQHQPCEMGVGTRREGGPELSGKMMDRAVQEGRGGPLGPPGSELSLQRDEGHGVLRELLLINIREK